MKHQQKQILDTFLGLLFDRLICAAEILPKNGKIRILPMLSGKARLLSAQFINSNFGIF